MSMHDVQPQKSAPRIIATSLSSLFLYFCIFDYFQYLTAIIHIPRASEPLQNCSMQYTEPRKSIPDHPQSQDSPYPVYDHAFLGSLQSSGVMLNPLLHFHFWNISIISIVSLIFIQPSVFIIVLFYSTHLSYPSYLPLPLYKPSCIYIQK